MNLKVLLPYRIFLAKPSVLRIVATSSPSWLVIRVSTVVQTAFGSRRIGFW